MTLSLKERLHNQAFLTAKAAAEALYEKWVAEMMHYPNANKWAFTDFKAFGNVVGDVQRIMEAEGFTVTFSPFPSLRGGIVEIVKN